jgi:magnesium transporter
MRMKKSRTKKLKNANKKLGMKPGSLVYVGSVEASKQHEPIINKIIYNTEGYEACELDAASLMALDISLEQKIWINVHGVHDAELIKKIGEKFNLHPLVLEDILNTEQRPKFDAFDDYVFLETRMFYFDKSNMGVSSEQISMVLGEHFLLTFQERATGTFESVRERLRAVKAPIRNLGTDYLAYALLDSIVDRYFKVLEEVSEASEELEDEILTKLNSNHLPTIHQLKYITIELRRAVFPMREVINALVRNENAFFKPTTLPYLRDLYDHTVNFIESLESIRDSLIGIMDIYMASMSQRVNLELRALTVVTMLFMPATLIAGIFGMNFNYMPWIQHHNGFWYALLIMAGIAIVMGLIFWRRQWIGSNNKML